MNNLILTPQTTLEEAILMLDRNGNGFLPVVNSEKVLIGIVTDGDLRRGVLNKTLNLNSIINKNPQVAYKGTSHIDVKRKLKALHRRHMPVVDKDGKLIEVVVLGEFEFVPKKNWVVIMAGGLGSRLGELTKSTPKPMLKVGEKPILHSIIEHFKSQGFCKFLLCVNYKGEVIEEYFEDGTAFGVEIRYTWENKRMGTAGALSLIDFEMQDPFFVVNADVLTSINYEDLLNYHEVNEASATMCVKKFEVEVPYACVDFNDNNDLLALNEKPSYQYHVNTGIYVLAPSVLSKIPTNVFFDMPTLFEELAQEKQNPKVFLMEDYWLDLGKPDDYKKGNADLKF